MELSRSQAESSSFVRVKIIKGKTMLPLCREARRSLVYFVVLSNNSLICYSPQLRLFFIQNSLLLLLLLSFFTRGNPIFSSPPFLIFLISLAVSVLHPSSLTELHVKFTVGTSSLQIYLCGCTYFYVLELYFSKAHKTDE